MDSSVIEAKETVLEANSDVRGVGLVNLPSVDPRIGYKCLAQDIRTSMPFVLSDLLATVAAWLLTFTVCSMLPLDGWLPGMRSMIAFVVAAPLAFLFMQLYPAATMHPALELQRLFTGIALLFLGLIITSVFYSERLVGVSIGRTIHFLFMVLTVVMFRFSTRSIFSRFRWWRQPTLIFGTRSQQKNLSEWISKQWYMGIRPVTHLEADSVFDSPTRAIVTPDVGFHLSFENELAWVYPRVTHVPEFLEEYPFLIFGVLEHRDRAGGQSHNLYCSPIQQIVKRVMDLGIVFCTLVVFFPLWLLFLAIVAIGIRATSKGSLIYGDDRMGQNGKTFKAWKFRTMVDNANDVLEKYLEENPEARAEWEEFHKLKNDPRVTPIGKFLRKTSLDEIPQLFNVVKGEMSLVGPRPRPVADAEIEEYHKFHQEYERVLPGITGMWQISGRNDTSYHERIHLDNYYVRNWSVWLDVFILIRTIKTVVFREGAY